jgi:hypothetical protein
MFDKLSAHFPVDAIHWRAQSVTDKNGGAALALAYLDARDVMDRLDEVCRPEGWQDSYSETPRGRLICTLSVLTPDGHWIAKSDGAGDTDVEGDKGAISDAFKRAAVKWGIGRYLYDLSNVWAPCELNQNGKWRKWKPEANAKFAAALNALAKPSGPINDKTRDWLAAQIDSSGITVGEVCKQFQVQSLKDITYENVHVVKGWLDTNKRKAA